MLPRTPTNHSLHSLKEILTPTLHLSKPSWKPHRHLDAPWTQTLGTSIKLTSLLLLVNSTLILLLGILSAATTDLSPSSLPRDLSKEEQDYIESHTMLLRAELVFFYLTIPLVYVATNVTENCVLWDDKLRPLYVVCAGVIGVNVWVLQGVLWGGCFFASSSTDGGLRGPGYCPYLFRGHGVELEEMQGVGSPRMVFYSVPTVILLHIAYLALGVIAYRSEKHPPKKTEAYVMSRPYNGEIQSDSESLPFRITWPSRDPPPRMSSDGESCVSPKTTEPVQSAQEEDEDGEMTPSLRAEHISLMLTTPHGTTEEQNPFDDDRLSRLGHRVN